MCMCMAGAGAMRHVNVSMAAQSESGQHVRVAASEKGDHTEQQAQDEADEIQTFPTFIVIFPEWCPRCGVCPASQHAGAAGFVPMAEESRADVP